MRTVLYCTKYATYIRTDRLPYTMNLLGMWQFILPLLMKFYSYIPSIINNINLMHSAEGLAPMVFIVHVIKLVD